MGDRHCREHLIDCPAISRGRRDNTVAVSWYICHTRQSHEWNNTIIPYKYRRRHGRLNVNIFRLVKRYRRNRLNTNFAAKRAGGRKNVENRTTNNFFDGQSTRAADLWRGWAQFDGETVFVGRSRFAWSVDGNVYAGGLLRRSS